ncbi:MAG: hypothetical protein ACYTA5_19890, partial [Planctomycetota bacterium]
DSNSTGMAESLSLTKPPGQYSRLSSHAYRTAETFKSGQPIIGTTYFYWYNIHTGEHIHNPDGTDALTTHPPPEEMADFSYTSTDWHYSQLRDMCQAGIDFALPVYWGTPKSYKAWSFAGLPPLVAAHDRMIAEHKKDPKSPKPPKIGLFYDTSIFRWHKHFSQKAQKTKAWT